jgi:hypothetical protein
MVRIRTDLPDTSSRREDAPQWRVPLGSYPDRQCRHPSSAGKARLAVHRPSACSGVKALPNTSVAKRQAAKLCYRFGPLTPSARSANLIAGDGTKNGLSRSEQKTVSATQNNRLTGKAPYKFESALLQQGVTCEPNVNYRFRFVVARPHLVAMCAGVAWSRLYAPRESPIIFVSGTSLRRPAALLLELRR